MELWGGGRVSDRERSDREAFAARAEDYVRNRVSPGGRSAVVTGRRSSRPRGLPGRARATPRAATVAVGSRSDYEGRAMTGRATCRQRAATNTGS